MSPINSYLCHSCMFEYDDIQGHEAPKSMDCPRCEEVQSAHRIPSVTATPRGSFGTTPRRAHDKVSQFNFDGGGQGEFPFLDEIETDEVGGLE